MDTDTALKILVIILSTTLAVFLIVSIILVVKLIQVAKHLNNITAKAEEIADKAEAVTEFFGRSAAPLAIGKLLGNIADAVSRNNKKEK